MEWMNEVSIDRVRLWASGFFFFFWASVYPATLKSTQDLRQNTQLLNQVTVGIIQRLVPQGVCGEGGPEDLSTLPGFRTDLALGHQAAETL